MNITFLKILNFRLILNTFHSMNSKEIELMIILLTCFLLFLISISILKSNGSGNAFFNLFAEILYHDKVGHFLLMGMLGFLVVAVVSPFLLKKHSRTVSIWLPTILLILLIGVEEYSQSFLSTRSCSWSDYWFGVIGVIMASSIYLLTSQRQ